MEYTLILMTDLKSLKSEKGLKLCHLNVRSLLSKFNQFKILFDNSKIDIITISETWLMEEIDSSILSMHNYQFCRADRAYLNEAHTAVKKGGGVITFIRKDHNFNIAKGRQSVVSDPNLEVQRIELASSVQQNLPIYNVYRPPSGSVSRCTELLNELLEEEDRLHLKEILILGDFNIDFNNKNSPDTKKIMSWQNKLGLSQKIKSKTRCAENSSSTIDLIFTNMDHVSSSGVIDLHISDHKPVYI